MPEMGEPSAAGPYPLIKSLFLLSDAMITQVMLLRATYLCFSIFIYSLKKGTKKDLLEVQV